MRVILPHVQVPTLAMSTRGDIERGLWGAGPWVAKQIPGARYVEIPDDKHFPMGPEVYRDFELFLSQIRDQESARSRHSSRGRFCVSAAPPLEQNLPSPQGPAGT